MLQNRDISGDEQNLVWEEKSMLSEMTVSGRDDGHVFLRCHHLLH